MFANALLDKFESSINAAALSPCNAIRVNEPRAPYSEFGLNLLLFFDRDTSD